MDRWHRWTSQTNPSPPAHEPVSESIDSSLESVESERWDQEIVASLRSSFQHHCSGTTLRLRRSDWTIDGRGREVDIGLQYPAACRAEVQTALDALGKHWPIHQEMERPVYLLVLRWNGRTCYVHLYDMGEPTHSLDTQRQEMESRRLAVPDLPTSLQPACRCLRASGMPPGFNHGPYENV